MLDKVFIEGLTLSAKIGVYDWEQQTRQKVIFNLEFGFDNRPAAATDAIADALNYAAAAERVEALVKSESFALIETLAERVAQMLLADKRIHYVKVTLHKPGAVFNAHSVGVEIVRYQAEVIR